MTRSLRHIPELDQRINRASIQPESIAPLIVLVVEDHDDSRTMLKILLEGFGCRVLEAADGQAAIRLAEGSQPDLILMDVRLPLVDGLTATRTIRERSWLRQVKIVAVTGDASAKSQLDAMAAGCNECLVKPIDFDRLELLVKMLFDKKLSAIDFKPKYWLALRSRGALACFSRAATG
jgi:CheY-like chemotaxis protein